MNSGKSVVESNKNNGLNTIGQLMGGINQAQSGKTGFERAIGIANIIATIAKL